MTDPWDMTDEEFAEHEREMAALDKSIAERQERIRQLQRGWCVWEITESGYSEEDIPF